MHAVLRASFAGRLPACSGMRGCSSTLTVAANDGTSQSRDTDAEACSERVSSCPARRSSMPTRERGRGEPEGLLESVRVELVPFRDD